MKVTVKLFASLRSKLPAGAKKAAEIELEAGSGLNDLLGKLGIAEEQAPMVLLNGEQLPTGAPARAEVRLHDGDTVSIFPSLAGG